MKNYKKILLIFSLLILNACAQSSAMLGPAITLGSGGSVYHAGLTFGSNKVLEKETGKSTIEHMSSILEQDESKQNIDEDFIILVEKNIEKTRKKLLKKN